MEPTVQLKAESILDVPIDKYDKNFTFIVNGEEYHTSRLVADLLSKKVSKLHFTDPTSNKIYINTCIKGDFNHFLSLQNFKTNEISNKDIKFIYEIAKQLQTTNIDIKVSRKEINIDNVLDLLSDDEQFEDLFTSEIEKEIDFISSNFSQFNSQQNEKFKKLNINTIERIITNKKFQIDNEDEFLRFVNNLYKEDVKYSSLYSYVYFENVEADTIDEFIDIFDFNEMTLPTWRSLTIRLKQKVTTDKEKVRHRQKREKEKTNENNCIKNIEYKNNHYEGIIEYFMKNSNINDEVKITASSIGGGDLEKVIQKDFPTKNGFYTKNISDSWICIEFKKHQVIPTNYTIRSNDWLSNDSHPRNWVIEGSSDSTNWEKIDEQKENSCLNGPNKIFTFQIQNKNQNKFKYIRIRQTGINWCKRHTLCLNYIELFGIIY